MSTIFIYGLCRCCHARGNFQSLGVPYVFEGREDNYAVMIRDTLGVLISPQAGENIAATYTICDACITSLQDAARFKQQVLACENKFADFVSFGQDVKVKIESLDEDVKNEDEFNERGILEIKFEKDGERKDKKPAWSTSETGNVGGYKEGSDSDAEWVAPPQFNQESTTRDSKSDTKDTPCHICNKKFSYQGLPRHMRTHKETKVYTCYICQSKFKTGRDLTVHLKLKHSDGTSYPCNVCSDVFESAKLLKKHLNDHYNKETVKCDICEKEYTRAGLKEHIRKIHNEIFICDICQKVFKQRHNMISHLFTHTGKKPCICETCGKSFQFERQLKCHISVIHFGEKPYECRFCPKRFPGKYPRELHERQHTGKRPFVCNICEKTFASNGTLGLHMITHSTEKPFSCTACGQQFSQLGNLKIHERTHSGEKQYSCEICARPFNHKGNLKTHMRIHTGETPYTCNICKEQFRFEISLQRHIRRHTGEKFNCHICNKQVSGNGKYKHLKKHRERGEVSQTNWPSDSGMIKTVVAYAKQILEGATGDVRQTTLAGESGAIKTDVVPFVKQNVEGTTGAVRQTTLAGESGMIKTDLVPYAKQIVEGATGAVRQTTTLAGESGMMKTDVISYAKQIVEGATGEVRQTNWASESGMIKADVGPYANQIVEGATDKLQSSLLLNPR